VGSNYALGHLYATGYDGGVININGGQVNTASGYEVSGDQDYYSPVVIGNQDATLTAGGNITFHSTVDSPSGYGLTTASYEVTTFLDAVGATGPLGHLYATAYDEGSIDINGGSVNTAATHASGYDNGDQTYTGPVYLSADAALQAAGNITFNGTVDSSASGTGHYGLTTTSSGDTSFLGAVGATHPLGFLLAEDLDGASMHINIDGGQVKTLASGYENGDQDYHDPVVIGANDTLTAQKGSVSGGGKITFWSTVDSAATGPTGASGPFSLTTNSDGDTTFWNSVGDILPLAALDATSNSAYINLKGGDISTTGNQDYRSQVLIDNLDANLGSSAGAITFHGTVDSQAPTGDSGPIGPYGLTTDSQGDTTFDGAVGGSGPTGPGALAFLTAVSKSGHIDINGGSVNTFGHQYYGSDGHASPVVIGADTDLTANEGVITFYGAVDSAATGPTGATGPFSLDSMSEGDTTFWGAVGSVNALHNLYVEADKSAGNGEIFLNAAPVNGSSVHTTGSQEYDGNVVLGHHDAVLTSDSSSIEFYGAVDSALDIPAHYGLTLNVSEVAGADHYAEFEEPVGDNGALKDLTVNAADINIYAPRITTLGDQTYQGHLWAYSNTVLSAANAGDGGNITFDGAVDSSYYSGVDDNISYYRNLTVKADGNVTFSQAVGDASPLGSLSLVINDAGSGQINLQGADIITHANQDYHGPVVIDVANANLQAGGGITFYSTVDSALTSGDTPVSKGFALTTRSYGDTTFWGEVGYDGSLGFLNASNLDASSMHIVINGDTVDTALSSHGEGYQEYGAPVMVGLLDAELSAYSQIEFYSTVDSQQHRGLTVSAGSSVIFGGMVGGISALGFLDATAGTNIGSLGEFSNHIEINGGGVTTYGDQDYRSPVWINTKDATLTATGGHIAFNNTVDSVEHDSDLTPVNYGLTIRATDDVTFGDPVGTFGTSFSDGNTSLAKLDVTSDFGHIDINGGAVTTLGAQAYHSNVLIGGEGATLTSQGSGWDTGDILFESVDSPGHYGLTVNDATTEFWGSVGLNSPLGFLTINANPASGYGILLAGGAVRTVNDQDYTGDLYLGVPTGTSYSGEKYLSSENGSIYFNNGIAAWQSGLNVSAAGNVRFDGSVGAPLFGLWGALDDLTVTSGKINLQGVIDTTGNQTYNGEVYLYDSSSLTAANSGKGGAITFNGQVGFDDNYDLTIAADGNVTFKDLVGDDGQANDLSVTINSGGSGSIYLLGGGIYTGGSQAYHGPVIIGSQDADLTADYGTVHFYDTVASPQGFGLGVSGASVIFDGTVGHGTGALGYLYAASNSKGDGDIEINGGEVSTVASGANGLTRNLKLGDYAFDNGDQTYNGDATIGVRDASLTSKGGAIAFEDRVGSAGQGLSAHATGDVTFSDVVGYASSGTGPTGATGPLGSLSAASDFGNIKINGVAVNTTGDQSYTGDVLVGNDVTLTAENNDSGGGITFHGKVDSTAYGATGATGPFSLTTTSDGDTTFMGAVGSLAPLASLSANIDEDSSGRIRLQGGSVTTVHQQQYSGPVLIEKKAATLTAAGSYADSYGYDYDTDDLSQVWFNGTVDSPEHYGLTVDAGRNIEFNAPVGLGSALGSLSATAFETDIAGGSIRTVGDQVYNSANSPYTGSNNGNHGMYLYSNAYLDSSAGKVTIASDVNSRSKYGYGLSVTAAGNIEFDGVLGTTPLGFLTAKTTGEGKILLNGGSITTAYSKNGSGDQEYAGPVVIGSQNLDLYASGEGSGQYESGGSIIFNGALDSAQGYGLNAQAEGDVIFNGLVGDASGACGISYLTATVPAEDSASWGSIYVNAAVSHVRGLTLHDYAAAYDGSSSYNDGNIYINDSVTATKSLDIQSSNRVYLNADVAVSDAVNGTGSIASAGYDTFLDPAYTVSDNIAVSNINTDELPYEITDGGLYINKPMTAAQIHGITDPYTDVFINARVTNSYPMSGTYYIADGNLEINAPVSNTGTFNLEVGNNIFAKAPISNSGTLSLLGDFGVSVKAPIANTGGSLTLTADSGVNIGAKITNTDVVNGYDTSYGDLTLASGSDSIYLGADISSQGGAQEYDGSVVLNKDVTLTGTGGNITFDDALISANGNQALTINHDAGAVEFGGLVGSLHIKLLDDNALASLSINGTGTTSIDGGGVATYSDQYYGGAVTIGESTTLNSPGGDITFSGTINGDNDLYVHAGNDVTFDGAVGKTTRLAEFEVTADHGDIVFNGLDNVAFTDISGYQSSGQVVSTNGRQEYHGSVVLGADTEMAAYHSYILFDGTVNGDSSLYAYGHHYIQFNDAVGNDTALASLVLTSDEGGIKFYGNDNVSFQNTYTRYGTQDSGQVVNTYGAQEYHGNVTFGNDTQLAANSGNITFVGNVNGDSNLYAYGQQGVTFNGTVGNSAPLASLVVAADNGSINIDGGAVTTVGDQDYHSPVVIDATNASLQAGGNITFSGAVDSALTTGASPVTEGYGLTVTSSGDTSFGGAVGGTGALGSLSATITGSGSVEIEGGAVNTTASGYESGTGDQAYHGPVVIASQNASLSAGGNITFGGTVDSASDAAYGLATQSSGNTTFAQAVGATAALASLTALTATGKIIEINADGVHSPGPGQTYHSVTTTGDQTYSGAVKVDGYQSNVILTSEQGAINFASTVNPGDSGVSLITNSYGDTTFGDAVGGSNAMGALTSNITGTGVININGVAMSIGDNYASGLQDYNGKVNIGANTTLIGGWGGNGGAVTFESTVDSLLGRSLTINSHGNVTFDGAVGSYNPLSTLAVTMVADSNINLNGGRIVTSGNQDYSGPVVIGAQDASLSASGTGSAVTFHGTVDSLLASGPSGLVNYGLTTESAGDTTFVAAVGANGQSGTTLAFLDATSSAGKIYLQGDVVDTTGDQTYTGVTRIGVHNAHLTSSDGSITFNGTVDSQNSTKKSLTVTAEDNVAFAGAVGYDYQLDTLNAVSSDGSIDLEGGNVKTNGDQTYTGAVRIGDQEAYLHSYSGNITFAKTVDSIQSESDGTYGLEADAAHNVVFNGRVGGGSPLADLTVGGIAEINGGGVTTTDYQAYNGAVLIGGLKNANLTSTGGDIYFNGAVDSADGEGLTTASEGTTIFSYAVGATGPLGYLTASADTGRIYLNGGSVRTLGSGYGNGDQQYIGALVLGADTYLSARNTEYPRGYGEFDGGSILFNATVDSNSGGHGLNTYADGDVIFNYAVGSHANDSGYAPLSYMNIRVKDSGDSDLNDLSWGSIYVNAPITNVGTVALRNEASASGYDNDYGNIYINSSIAATGVGSRTYDGDHLYVNSNNSVYVNAGVGLGGAGTTGHIIGRFAFLNVAPSLVTGNVKINGSAPASYTNPDDYYIDPVTKNLWIDTPAGFNEFPVGEYNDVYVNAPLTNGGSLVLAAQEGRLELNAPISNSGAFIGKAEGDISLKALVTNSGSFDLYAADGGSVYVSAPITNSATGSSVRLDATDEWDGGSVVLNAKINSLGAADSVTMAADDGIYLGADVTTHGSQTYAGDVYLQKDETLSSNNGDLTFTGNIDSFDGNGGQRLAIANGTGNVTFDGAVGHYGLRLGSLTGVDAGLAALSISGNGTTHINGGAVTTLGDQYYGGAVVIDEQDATLTSTGGGITFNSTVDSAGGLDILSSGLSGDNYGLTTDSYGDTSFKGAVGISGRLNFSSEDYGALAFLDATTEAGTIYLGGNSSIDMGSDEPDLVSAMGVLTSGNQDYHGPVVLKQDAYLISVENLTFHGTVDSAVQEQTGEVGDLLEAVSFIGDVTFDRAVGHNQALSTLMAGRFFNYGHVNLNGGGVSTSGDQVYVTGVVIGGQNANLYSDSGDITFAGKLDSYQGFGLTASGGNVTFEKTVGTAPLGFLTASASEIALNGGGIRTSGDQDYQDPVRIGVQAAVLTSGAGNITFGDAVDSVGMPTGPDYSLTTRSYGDTTFSWSVGDSHRLASLDATSEHGSINLDGGDVITAGDQDYHGPVVIDATNASLQAGGNITFSGAVDSALTTGASPVTKGYGLTTTSSGDTSFGGAVGGTGALGSLSATITGSGHIDIDGGAVNTTASGYESGTGDQAYNGPVVIASQDASLKAGGNITFSGTVDSASDAAYGLATQSSGNTTFAQAVGATGPLGQLSAAITGAGSIDINGGAITTAGDQDYEGLVLIGNLDATLTATRGDYTAGDITFHGAVSSVNHSLYNYGLTTWSQGDTTFDGAVGFSDDEGVNALAFLSAHIGTIVPYELTRSGSIYLKGGDVWTWGDQEYNGPVMIADKDASIQAHQGNVTFDKAVDAAAGAPYGLTIKSKSNVNFLGSVGEGLGAKSNMLTSLVVLEKMGSINLEGGSVATYKDQTYMGNVGIIQNDADLYSDSGDISFQGTVNSAATGPSGLTVYAKDGVVVFKNTVGGSFISESVVSSNSPLAFLDVRTDDGSILLNGGHITTVGDQDYRGPVVIDNSDAVLTASRGGNVTFHGTVDSGYLSNTGLNAQDSPYTTYGLTVNADNSVEFDGAVGTGGLGVGEAANIGLAHLEVHSGLGAAEQTISQSILLNGGAIRTDGDQDYYGPVYIGVKDADLQAGGNITFHGMVDSNARSQFGPAYYGLTTQSGGNTTFDSWVGDNQELAFLTAGIGYGADVIYTETPSGRHININGGEVSTYGDQTYNGDVRIGARDADLWTENGNVTFGGAVDSDLGYGLDVVAYGTGKDVTFSGAVGATGPLGSLYAYSDGGFINIDGGQVSTVASYEGSDARAEYKGGYDSGDQIYDSAVLINDKSATLSAGGNITFSGAVDSGYYACPNGAVCGSGLYGLTTTSVADTRFEGAVGVKSPLAHLDVTATGAGSHIYLDGGNLITTDYQSYTGSVVLGADTTMDTQAGAVTFEGTLNTGFNPSGPTGATGPYGLTIDTSDDGYSVGDAVVTLDAIGNESGNELDFLDISGTGQLIMHGNITTLASQSYDRPVTIAPDGPADSDGPASITLRTLGNSRDGWSSIEFANTVDGNSTGTSDLILHAAGSYYGGVWLEKAVGGNIPLTSLTVKADVEPEDILPLEHGYGPVDGDGSLYIGYSYTPTVDAPAMPIKTTGAQNYEGPVYLDSSANFTTAGGPVHFYEAIHQDVYFTCAQPGCGVGYDLFVNTNGGDLTLDESVGDAQYPGFIQLRGGNVVWNGDLTGTYLQILGSNLTMNGNVTATSVSPDDGTGVLMIANNTFKNNGSDAIHLLGGGRWLIYSVDPNWNSNGGLVGTPQWSTTWANGPAPAFSGNGFLYSTALPLPTPQERQSFNANQTLVKWDVPMPGASTHGNGFFSIIETPKFTTIYRDEHPGGGNPTGPGTPPAPEDDHHKKNTTSINKGQDKIHG